MTKSHLQAGEELADASPANMGMHKAHWAPHKAAGRSERNHLGQFSQEKTKQVSGRRILMIKADTVGSEPPITGGVKQGLMMLGGQPTAHENYKRRGEAGGGYVRNVRALEGERSAAVPLPPFTSN